MRQKVTVDTKDPRILHMEWTNTTPIPMSAFAGAVKLRRAPKGLLDFKMFMVTRRSIVNPGEVLKIRVELPAPFEEYPDNAYLELSYRLPDGWWQPRFKLNPDRTETK